MAEISPFAYEDEIVRLISIGLTLRAELERCMVAHFSSRARTALEAIRLTPKDSIAREVWDRAQKAKAS